ncbi:hypothetical protein ONS96_011660 [Cadophora gregata f. sp. sojae]|nr:hypothetical protein ONS96_011660 [Cadophora gregata f. sp. sojae]
MGPSDLFDPFIASVSELQSLLSAGELNSSTIVDSYLKRIAADDDYLRSVVETTPREILNKEIKRLDDERAAGKVRSPLHGIPFLVKVGQRLTLCISEDGRAC